MKTKSFVNDIIRPTAFILLALAVLDSNYAAIAQTKKTEAIPWNQIGAKAGADYKGEGLTVTPTESGARLHCVFQRLAGEATREGLWLTSTVTNSVNDRFRVMAAAVGRGKAGPSVPAVGNGGESVVGELSLVPGGRDALPCVVLPHTGEVSLDGQTVRFNPSNGDGRIHREHGRRAAGFCGAGETGPQPSTLN